MGESTGKFALTADLGNSSLKLCLFELKTLKGAAPRDFGPLLDLRLTWAQVAGEQTDASLLGQVSAWLGDSSIEGVGSAGAAGAISIVLLSSVAGRERTMGVCSCLADLGLPEPHAGLSAGLRNATMEPTSVGHDRLFAVRGAIDHLYATPPGKASGGIVVDAGTALTVDAFVLGSDAQPSFLGGSIAPGPGLLAEVLGRQAAQLPRIDPRPGAPALGRGTRAALQAGVVVGFRGAAAHLVCELSRETGLGTAPVFLTGGARDFLLEPSPFLLQRELIVDPWLVERGLLASFLGGSAT